ncbi:MAG TPA: hypothetical protein VEA80_04775 [Vitreimonas sp.]|uniref:hypothetical protein n=1 Tax=Vitreimonas sp. TaxID=3069702 RepID=UPI002D323DE3|nr:hypothetical protein [Vitreimonas sp.]HYD86765.1 hypothetical protein [Vitreimonas sp.]
MRNRIYSHTWADVAFLDADHIARWGAFDGYRGPVAFEGLNPRKADLEHDKASDALRVFYTCDGERVLREAIKLERDPCRYGGERVCFRAPCCGRRTRKLAFLEQGVRCARCGSITTAPRRGGKIERAIIKAETLARRLGCAHWRGPITRRPPYMKRATFDRLADAHAAAVARADLAIAPQMEKAAARGPAAQLNVLLRAGL